MHSTARAWAVRLLLVVGVLATAHGEVSAAAYTINVTGTFNLSTFAPPASNSLAGLLGTSFSGSFTSDSDPGSFAADSATRPGEIGWYLVGSPYGLTVAGATGYPSPDITTSISDDFFISAVDAMGLLSDGHYDVFDLEGYAPDLTNAGAGCEPLDGLACALATGRAYRFVLVGNTGMLTDPTAPGPSTIDLSAVRLALLIAEDYDAGNLIGDAYAVGRLAPGSTIANIDITPVPEPGTGALLLAGLGVLGLGVQRLRRAAG